MKIIFTGHRNKRVDQKLLEDLYEKYPDAIWCHGNAKDGFDKQVDDFVLANRIACKRYSPIPHSRFSYRTVLLARNVEMANDMQLGDKAFACWDGRIGGGTWYTKGAIERNGFEVEVWKPL